MSNQTIWFTRMITLWYSLDSKVNHFQLLEQSSRTDSCRTNLETSLRTLEVWTRTNSILILLSWESKYLGILAQLWRYKLCGEGRWFERDSKISKRIQKLSSVEWSRKVRLPWGYWSGRIIETRREFWSLRMFSGLQKNMRLGTCSEEQFLLIFENGLKVT